MRLFQISCPGCGWRAPLPVLAAVAQKFREKKYCIHCKETRNEDVPYTIRESKVTGPTQYFPPRD